MINCEKATELTSKKIDRKLSFMEKLTLKFHVMMCSTCSMFEVESDVITKVLLHNHSENCKHKMSSDSKNKLKELLKNKK